MNNLEKYNNIEACQEAFAEYCKAHGCKKQNICAMEYVLSWLLRDSDEAKVKYKRNCDRFLSEVDARNAWCYECQEYVYFPEVGNTWIRKPNKPDFITWLFAKCEDQK